MSEADAEWRRANHANWEERVAVHLGPGSDYDLASLRAGRGKLHPIEEAELGPVAGLRVLHLQCHFGRDSLALAQRGALVTGLDFSGQAIAAARRLAVELGLASRSHFVEADLYDAPNALAEPRAFDLVFVSWGALNWLSDIGRWAKVVAHFLKPDGALYLAEGHPLAMVFDDRAGLPNGMPGIDTPYFHAAPIVLDNPQDYADPAARLSNARTYEWIHPLGAVVSALGQAGLALQWLHEHDCVAWKMFEILQPDADGMYRWPDRPWLPLSYSLRAVRG
ncbi:MAG TPA: class I SAM-dependent methyltransferase [Candidatus Sulfotelmatobacter sp.]|nr:class I SAM-dependent methyltransferase [Candidatus Sulfotelmatobacter sp.]